MSVARRLRDLFKRLYRDAESGQAMLEFVLVFPVQLLITLGIIQFALMKTGQITVNHAAFAAARAVLVADSAGRSGGGAQADAEDAARIVMSAVAGTTRSRAGGRSYDIPGWGKLHRSYAASEKTRVQIFSQEGDVAVEVSHDFELSVPVINDFFAFPWEGFLGYPASGTSPYPDWAARKALARRYGGQPHLVFKETCTLAKPWRGDGGGP